MEIEEETTNIGEKRVRNATDEDTPKNANNFYYIIG